MVVDQVMGSPTDIIYEVGRLGKLIQALGLIVIIWIIVQLVSLYLSFRRKSLLKRIESRLDELDRKLGTTKKKRKK